MHVNLRDAAAGGIFIVIAALFALGATDLAMGSALRMGPGYFPLLLAGLLGALGVIIVLKAVGKAQSPISGVPWRGAILILAAPIVFGFTIRWFGLAPSIALVVAISAFASQRSTIKLAVGLTVVLTVFCVLVFQKMLGLPVPMFAGPFDPLNAMLEPVFAPIGAGFSAVGAFLSGAASAIRGLFS